MTPAEICTSLELSKKLKSLGYPQEGSCFYWVISGDGEWQLWSLEMLREQEWYPYDKEDENEFIAAPTASEIGEWIRRMWSSWREANGDWTIIYQEYYNANFTSKALSEALGQCLAYLIEKGEVKFK